MNRIKYRDSLLSGFILLIALNMMPLLSAAQSLDPGRLKQFEEAILKGEDFLKADDYAKAKAEYQKALSIDPSAKYPKDKLAQIRKVYIDPEDEARFASAMESGNRLMQSGSYTLASEQFANAVKLPNLRHEKRFIPGILNWAIRNWPPVTSKVPEKHT